MSASIPLTPDVAVLLALSFAGVAFVVLSRATAAKRIVLPGTAIVFHVAGFLILQRSGAIAGWPIAVVIVALIANAVVVCWRLGYCARGGRTIADRSPGAQCSKCAAD